MPEYRDPRYNAPPIISELSLAERRRAMHDRFEVSRRRFMADFIARSTRQPSLVARLFKGRG